MKSSRSRLLSVGAILTMLSIVGCSAPADTPNSTANNSSTTNVQSETSRRTADADDCFSATLDKSMMDDLPQWKSPKPDIDKVEVALHVGPGKAGESGRLILYTPHGQHRRSSLACVFIAPAGAPMFAGNSLGDGDSAEHLPYVKAGFAVAAFELDGESNGSAKTLEKIRPIYAKFKAAGGGVVNGKNALEYVLAKLPEVDPNRLYVAGHSSAATFALLFAEHEKRLHGCIAFAPLSDLFARAPDKRAALEEAFPGIGQLSPQESIANLKCPVFLFHAEDDSNVPIEVNKKFAELLKQTNNSVTFHTVATGDHYLSMIKEGIPQGIQWLKSLPDEAKAEPTLPKAN